MPLVGGRADSGFGITLLWDCSSGLFYQPPGQRTGAARWQHGTHRHIKGLLPGSGITLNPLMLVQVPNRGGALEKRPRVLDLTVEVPRVGRRVQMPTPDLQVLEHAPTVEMLAFKMLVAMGFRCTARVHLSEPSVVPMARTSATSWSAESCACIRYCGADLAPRWCWSRR